MFSFDTLLIIWLVLGFAGGIMCGAIISAGRSGGDDRINRKD